MADFVEFNTNHYPSGPRGGQFAPGATGGAPAVSTVSEAISRILKGQNVVLKDVHSVHTLLTKLAAIAQDAKAKGEKAPTYNLCTVSVPGTNLFCGDKLKTAEFPNGIPRLAMPQFKGEPTPGTPSARLAQDHKGFVDGAPAFVEHLKSLGIGTTTEWTPAARLRASQEELDGVKVANMMVGPKSLGRGSIFVSSDNYVIDGHHRWAAQVGRDAEDNKLGEMHMTVVRVHAPMSKVYHIAHSWAKTFGIRSKGVAEAGLTEFNWNHDPKNGEFSSGSEHMPSLHPRSGSTYVFHTSVVPRFEAKVVSSRDYDAIFGAGSAAKAKAQGHILVQHRTSTGQSYVSAVPRATWIQWHGSGRVPIPN